MAKKGKTKGKLHPSPHDTQQHAEQMQNPEHNQISSNTQRPQGNIPTPQGGDMWGQGLNPQDVLQPNAGM